MARISKQGYIERKTSGKGHQGRKVRDDPRNWRDWWLVKHGTHQAGSLNLKNVCIPACFVGKKVRFKLEVLEDDFDE